MKVIIAGGRGFSFPESIEIVEKAVVASGLFSKIETVVHGAAPGIDTGADHWAKFHGRLREPHPAAWNHWRSLPEDKVKLKRNKKGYLYNVLAGFNRNEEMALVGDALIAIPGKVSPGTRDMIERAKNHGLEVFVYDTKTGKEERG